MARFVEVIDLPMPLDEAFDYLADFSRTEEWDPSVVEATRISTGEVRLGSAFEVTVSFFGVRSTLEYRITEFDRPSRLVLKGGDSSLRSIDEITFAAKPGGTRVTYEARLELGGIRSLADPILDVVFQQVGRQAVRGLEATTAARDAIRNTKTVRPARAAGSQGVAR